MLYKKNEIPEMTPREAWTLLTLKYVDKIELDYFLYHGAVKTIEDLVKKADPLPTADENDRGYSLPLINSLLDDLKSKGITPREPKPAEYSNPFAEMVKSW